MNWQANAAQALDEWQIRRLALLYAHAVDRRLPEIMEQIFTADGFIDTGIRRREGHEGLRAMLAWAAEHWLATMHKVHNQLVTVHGDTAEAETYCTAEHLERDRGGGTTLYSMSIRYADRLVKQSGTWRFSSRTLTVEWSDVRQVVWQSERPRAEPAG